MPRQKGAAGKAPRRSGRVDFAHKIGPDYNRRWLNCNVAEKRFGAAWRLSLPPLARPAKGRPQVGAKMTKSPARPTKSASKTASNKAARAGTERAQAQGGDGALLARIAGALERLAPAPL